MAMFGFFFLYYVHLYNNALFKKKNTASCRTNKYIAVKNVTFKNYYSSINGKINLFHFKARNSFNYKNLSHRGLEYVKWILVSGHFWIFTTLTERGVSIRLLHVNWKCELNNNNLCGIMYYVDR